MEMHEIKEYSNLLADEMLSNKEAKIKSIAFQSGIVVGIFITLTIVAVIILVQRFT